MSKFRLLFAYGSDPHQMTSRTFDADSAEQAVDIIMQEGRGHDVREVWQLVMTSKMPVGPSTLRRVP